MMKDGLTEKHSLAYLRERKREDWARSKKDDSLVSTQRVMSCLDNKQVTFDQRLVDSKD